MFEVWLFCMLVQGFQMCYKQNIQFWTEFHQSGNISQPTTGPGPDGHLGGEISTEILDSLWE